MILNLPPVAITGIGSVSPYGPLAGLIQLDPLQSTALTWKGERQGFLVP